MPPGTRHTTWLPPRFNAIVGDDSESLARLRHGQDGALVREPSQRRSDSRNLVHLILLRFHDCYSGAAQRIERNDRTSSEDV